MEKAKKWNAYGSLKADRAWNLFEGQNQTIFFVTEASSHDVSHEVEFGEEKVQFLIGFVFKIFFSFKTSIPMDKRNNSLVQNSWLSTLFLKEVQWVSDLVRLARWEQLPAWQCRQSQERRERGDTQVLTLDQPCNHHTPLPSSDHWRMLSPSYTYTNMWKMLRMVQTHPDTKTRTMFTTKSQKNQNKIEREWRTLNEKDLKAGEALYKKTCSDKGEWL